MAKRLGRFPDTGGTTWPPEQSNNLRADARFKRHVHCPTVPLIMPNAPAEAEKDVAKEAILRILRSGHGGPCCSSSFRFWIDEFRFTALVASVVLKYYIVGYTAIQGRSEKIRHMKASVIHEYGGPDVLKYEDYPDPVLQPGEVLVRVAAGVNPVDTLERSGQTKEWRPIQFPGVLRWDLSGIVEKLGVGVQGFSRGDQVLAWAYHTYAELCAVKVELLARVPNGMNLVDAAALPLVTMTGSQLIYVAADVKPGQTVLVSGAAGSVGRSAVFAAKDRGAVVIAGVLKRQLNAAKDLGVDRVVALDNAIDFANLEPVDVIANTVRGKTSEDLMDKVKQGGTFASVTGAPANAARYPGVRTVAFVSRQDTKNLEHTVEAVRAGKLTIPIGSKLPLRKAADAHIAMATGGVGKILLLP